MNSKPSAPVRRRSATGARALLVGTRKGAFVLYAGAGRDGWKLKGPSFLGHSVHHLVLDPRDGRTLVCAAKAGHLGPTVFRSTDRGRTWTEASRPPAFEKSPKGQTARSVDHVFWMTPAHASEPGAWYAGTSPQGLFRSEDGGATWKGVRGFNDHRMRAKWCGDGQGAPPDGATLHSICIDPRDAHHLYIGMSTGGTFESTDGGNDWKPLNAGCRADFMPDPYPEFGQDVHCMRLHPLAPDRLYQQNHCGIYRMDRGTARWERIGERMPKSVGDIGFPMVLHPHDPDTLWVFPMDGSTVWPRVSPGGRPAAYVSRNGGKSWRRLDTGLPRSQGWFTVKRQAMCADRAERPGVYFGTTGGEIWAGANEGSRWKCVARHLPEVYSLEWAEFR